MKSVPKAFAAQLKSIFFEINLHWRDIIRAMRQHGFVDRNVDLQGVYSHVKDALSKQGFKITSEEIQDGYWDLQARKAGPIRIATGTVRDVDLIIAGNSNKFSVQLRAGIWGRDFLVPAAEGVATFGVAAAAELQLAKDFEQKFWEEIINFVDPSMVFCDKDGEVFDSEKDLEEHRKSHIKKDALAAKSNLGPYGL